MKMIKTHKLVSQETILIEDSIFSIRHLFSTLVPPIPPTSVPPYVTPSYPFSPLRMYPYSTNVCPSIRHLFLPLISLLNIPLFHQRLSVHTSPLLTPYLPFKYTPIPPTSARPYVTSSYPLSPFQMYPYHTASVRPYVTPSLTFKCTPIIQRPSLHTSPLLSPSNITLLYKYPLFSILPPTLYHSYHSSVYQTSQFRRRLY